MNRSIALSAAAILLLALGACSSRECRLDDPEACAKGLTCEVVQGSDQPLCFEPVELRGKVFDLESGQAVGGARVTAVDVNGAPVGQVATSDGTGNYALRVPSTRADEKGTPVARKLSLRAAAQDYQPFPSGLRVSLPVDTGAVAQNEEEGPWTLEGGQADIGLALLPEADRGHPRITGTVELAAGQGGVLVVAQSGALPGLSSIADSDGSFVLFNARPATWSVRAFTRGANYTPVDAEVKAGTDVNDVRLARNAVEAGTVTGSVSIVAGSGQTSVIMVVASTFNENLGRGEMPPGLRAPEPGTEPNVTGAFTITGVPDGEYVMLAAFENDNLVRDPDPNIAGTSLQRLTVTNGQPDRQPSFKVTSAMALLSPGGGDTLEVTSATPALRFQSYSSAKSYVLKVFDTFGTQVWETTAAAKSGEISVPYAGETLRSGRVYQWRVTALGNAGNPISTSEDLKGVFRVE
jgi:hypothetical protein